MGNTVTLKSSDHYHPGNARDGTSRQQNVHHDRNRDAVMGNTVTWKSSDQDDPGNVRDDTSRQQNIHHDRNYINVHGASDAFLEDQKRIYAQIQAERARRRAEETASIRKQQLEIARSRELEAENARAEQEREERSRVERYRQHLEAAWEEKRRLEAAREQQRQLEAAREEERRLEAAREEKRRLEAAREEQWQLEAAREEERRLKAAREEKRRLEAAREEQWLLEAVREQQRQLGAARAEEERRLEPAREEKRRLEAAREQQRQLEAAREEERRLKAAREEKRRLEVAREEKRRLEAAREEKRRLQAAREEERRLEAAREEKRRLEAAREQQRQLEAARAASVAPIAFVAARDQQRQPEAAREQDWRLVFAREQEWMWRAAEAGQAKQEEERRRKATEAAQAQEKLRLAAEKRRAEEQKAQCHEAKAHTLENHVENRAKDTCGESGAISLPEVCRRYNTRQGCANDNCQRLHICRLLLASICKHGVTCRKGHTLTTVHNQMVCSLYRLDKIEDVVIIQHLRRAFEENDDLPEHMYLRNLERCFRFGWTSHCEQLDCNRLHICRNLADPSCTCRLCRAGHDLHTTHNRGVIVRHRLAHLCDEEILQLLRENDSGEKQPACAAKSSKEKGAVSHWKSTGNLSKPKVIQTHEEPSAGGATGPAPAAATAATSALSAELQCPICLDMFSRATTLGCAHTFCAPCLQRARSKSGDRCPLCRADITSAIRSVTLDNIIRNVMASQ